jgi:hypothetical protein
MKTRSIFFALAISSCSAVPAFAQNAIVSASIDATPLSLNGVNYPAVTITPGTTANGSTIAVGNITPLQYRGALGFTNGPPDCILQFQDDGAGVSPSSITQAPNGDWQITINIMRADQNVSGESATPLTEAHLIDTSNHQLHLACAAKGPAAPPPQ